MTETSPYEEVETVTTQEATVNSDDAQLEMTLRATFIGIIVVCVILIIILKIKGNR